MSFPRGKVVKYTQNYQAGIMSPRIYCGAITQLNRSILCLLLQVTILVIDSRLIINNIRSFVCQRE